MYTNDNRIVMTLDAGGTNFVFSAIQGGKGIADPVVLPACADCLDKCLGNLSRLAGNSGRYQFRFSRSGGLSSRYHRRPAQLPFFPGRGSVGPVSGGYIRDAGVYQ